MRVHTRSEWKLEAQEPMDAVTVGVESFFFLGRNHLPVIKDSESS